MMKFDEFVSEAVREPKDLDGWMKSFRSFVGQPWQEDNEIAIVDQLSKGAPKEPRATWAYVQAWHKANAKQLNRILANTTSDRFAEEFDALVDGGPNKVDEASGARKPKTKPVTQAEFDRIAKEVAADLLGIYRDKGFDMTMDDCMKDVLARMPNQYRVVKESAVNEGYGLGDATREEAVAAIKQHGLKPTSWAFGIDPVNGRRPTPDFAAKLAKFFRVSDENPPRVIAYTDDPDGPNGRRTHWVEYTT